MKTTLSSDKKIVTISTAGPFIVIGEKINPTGRKKMAAVLEAGDFDYIQDLAVSQVQAGADVLKAANKVRNRALAMCSWVHLMSLMGIPVLPFSRLKTPSSHSNSRLAAKIMYW